MTPLRPTLLIVNAEASEIFLGAVITWEGRREKPPMHFWWISHRQSTLIGSLQTIDIDRERLTSAISLAARNVIFSNAITVKSTATSRKHASMSLNAGSATARK